MFKHVLLLIYDFAFLTCACQASGIADNLENVGCNKGCGEALTQIILHHNQLMESRIDKLENSLENTKRLLTVAHDEKQELQAKLENLEETVLYLKNQYQNSKDISQNSVAFTAYATQDYYYYEPGNRVQFEATWTNIGNAYDTSTSIFTCPAKGLYLFSTTVYVEDGKEFWVEIIHNGNSLAGLHGTSGANSQSTNTVVIQCLELETVWVMVEHSAEIHGVANSDARLVTFTGVLLNLL